MRRKLVSQGGVTATVSLPSSWIKNFKLKIGDEINVQEKENMLIISPGESLAKESISIDITKLNPIRSTLMRLYHQGYDEIRIKTSDPKQLSVVREVLPEFLGFEILEQKKDSCVLRMITGQPIENFDNMYRRLFLLLLSMAEEGYDALKEKDKVLLENLKNRDLEVNRFVHVCLRDLNIHGYKEFRKTPIMYAVILKLEEIGDLYKEVFEIGMKKDNFKIYFRISELLRKCYEFSFDCSKKYGDYIRKPYYKIKKEIHSGKGNVLIVLKALNEHIVQIHNLQLAFMKDL